MTKRFVVYALALLCLLGLSLTLAHRSRHFNRGRFNRGRFNGTCPFQPPQGVRFNGTRPFQPPQGGRFNGTCPFQPPQGGRFNGTCPFQPPQGGRFNGTCPFRPPQEENSQPLTINGYSIVNTLCYCVKPPTESSEQSESGAMCESSALSADSDMLTCFCLEADDADNVLPPNNVILNTTMDTDAVTIQLGRNVSDQVALVCSCAYPEATSNNNANDSFLFDGYDGRAPVAANCTCVNPYERRNYDSMHYENITIPQLNLRVTIPMPGSFFTHNFADLILPFGCNCTLPQSPYFNGTIIGYDQSFPAAVCKCDPTMNSRQINAPALLVDTNIAFNATIMNLPQLSLDLPAFNVSSISGIAFNLSDVIPSWDYSVPRMNVTIPGTDIVIKVPPFLNISFDASEF